MSVLRNQNDTIIQRNLFRNKAVSDGAISFYLDHFVRTRVSKVTYGAFVTTEYDASAPEHRSRSHSVFASVSGEKRIPGFFDIILPKVSFLIPFFTLKSMLLKWIYKNTQVSETKEFRRGYNQPSGSTDLFRCFSISVSCYRGDVVTPEWKDVDAGESNF